MTQANVLSALGSPGVSTGFKNRIINGAMMIDQRNAGASVTVSAGVTQYTLDRFINANGTGSGVCTAQQVSDAPTGFINSLKTTITTAQASLSGTENMHIRQPIEGLNVADLSWGSASAQTVTVSFWVKSSLTGSFGFTLRNGSSNRSYPALYTISSADTWEYKTITIPGDTTGTWLTTNGIGVYVQFSLGAASARQGTPNAWAAASYTGAVGETSVVGTSGATFYITGVQLEKGSTATSFDYRPYGTELALCQRYYYKMTADTAVERFGAGYAASTTVSDGTTFFPVQMRTSVSAIEQSGTAANYCVQQATGKVACSSVPTFLVGGVNSATTRFTVASGLTLGQGNFIRADSTSAYLAWSAEL